MVCEYPGETTCAFPHCGCGKLQNVSAPIFVYRVQDKDGRGPFKPGFSQLWVRERKDHENLIPWFEEFGPVQNKVLAGESAGCGCKELEQLRRWFTKTEYKKLKKLGYRAVKIKVNRLIAESEIQCVFGRAKPLCEDIKTIRLY